MDETENDIKPSTSELIDLTLPNSDDGASCEELSIKQIAELIDLTLEGSDNEINDELTAEQLNLKINTFRNLSADNKINMANAFDMDMVRYLKSWLSKKRITKNTDLSVFKEVSDYLDASGKIYGYRVDNLSNSINKLLDEFKTKTDDEVVIKQEPDENDKNDKNKKNYKIKKNKKSYTNYKYNKNDNKDTNDTIDTNVTNDTNDENDENDDEYKFTRYKRSRLMLTTNEKLRRKPEDENNFASSFAQHIPSLDFEDIFLNHIPSHYMSALFHDYTLLDEMKILNAPPKTNDRDIKIKIPTKTYMKMKHAIETRSICPDLSKMFPEYESLKKKRKEKEKEERENIDTTLEGIEYRFDPNSEKFQNFKRATELIATENAVGNNNESSSGLSEKEKRLKVFKELLDCVDNTLDNDYSYFNPALLAKWNGPEAWKAQAMSKALKGRKPIEQKNVSDNKEIDEVGKQDTKQPKKKKEAINKVKISWSNGDDAIDTLTTTIEDSTKIQLLPRILEKWNEIDNLHDSTILVGEVKYKFSLLKYHEMYPNWWKLKKQNVETIDANENSSGFSHDQGVEVKHGTKNDEQIGNLSNSDSGEIQKNYVDISNTSHDEIDTNASHDEIDTNASHDEIETNASHDEIDTNASHDDENDTNTSRDDENDTNASRDDENDTNASHDDKNDTHKDSDDDDDNLDESGKMDIGEVKKEIFEIIDQECVTLKTDSKWSSPLSFSDLLLKLKVGDRDELSVPIVYVCLLHLTNERGLKLFQEPSTSNDKEIFIAKPITME